MTLSNSIDSQLNLDAFSDPEQEKPINNTCCVVMNGECKNVEWQELFYGHKFDIMRCVTYVSSPSFLAEAIDGFKNVQIIIGIEKEDVRGAFANGLQKKLNGVGAEFFEGLPDNEKNKLINATLKVKYAKTNAIIHSKFYLLSSSKTDDTRLIFGSANLTKTAFSNEILQFEDVMVYDNNPLFNIYEERFNLLYKNTEDYIPRKIIEKYQKGELISVADLTPEEKTNDLIDTLRQDNIVPLCNEAVLDLLKDEAEKGKKESDQLKTSLGVIIAAGKREKRGSNNYIMKSSQELAAAKPKIVDIIYKGTKTELESGRFALTYNDTDKKQYRIFPKQASSESQRPPEVFDKEASPKEICAAVQNLNAFIAAYNTYVTEPDIRKQNLARIFEIILYAFTSSYIFKLRQDALGSKSDIPIMLVIGGRASSGKSNLLAYINRILSGQTLTLENHFLQYKNVQNKGIEELFHSDNTYPLLIDEVSPSFFRGQRGEDLIKGLSNSLDGRHPVMICTTNTGAFHMPPQVSRRIYYLQVDSCFDTEKKASANKYYENIMSEASNDLFRDFCFKMGEKIRLNENLFGLEDFDYLHSAREIFKEYYSIAGIALPNYFPTSLYNDYLDRGKRMWETLFLQRQEKFEYTALGKNGAPELTIALKDALVGNSKTDMEVYLNYLRSDLLVEEAGIFIKIKADPFFDWIEIANPWKKKFTFKNLVKRISSRH